MQFPDINRIIANRALPGLPALPAAPRQLGRTTTDFGRTAPIEVAGLPSVKIRPRVAGDITSGVVIEVTLRSRYAANLNAELAFLNGVAEAMLSRYVAMSQGTLSRGQLSKMGHPYGRDKNSQARRVPRGVGFVRGFRGSAPALTVINRQSGDLARSWEKEVALTPTGAVMRFSNDSLPAFLLAAGTKAMQAHGPFSYVPSTFQGRIRSAWQAEVSRARSAFIMQGQAEQSLSIGGAT